MTTLLSVTSRRDLRLPLLAKPSGKPGPTVLIIKGLDLYAVAEDFYGW
jgi:hypothetical protein